MSNVAVDFVAGDASPQTKTPVIAERYKTKQCRNYVQTGSCPYEARCMFAHGEAELRTKEMNVADGLVTEEAVKQHQRRLRGATNATTALVNGMSQQLPSPVGARKQAVDPTATTASLPLHPSMNNTHLHHHHQGMQYMYHNPYDLYSAMSYGAAYHITAPMTYEPAKSEPVPFSLPEELVPKTPATEKSVATFEAPTKKVSSEVMSLFSGIPEAP